jgi:hypothetical protein
MAMDQKILKELRAELLHLHKALIERQKKQHEGKFGKIVSPNELFGLLTKNQSFAWLRTLSELIVALDELMDSREPESEAKLADMLEYVSGLLDAKKEHGKFQEHYFSALKDDPQTAVAHGRVTRILKGKRE